MSTPLGVTLLLCSERSGGNLVTASLGNHPAICGPPPSHLLRILAWNMDRFGDLRDDEEWRALCEAVTRIMDAPLGEWLTRTSTSELTDVDDRSAGGLLRHIYRREAKAQAADRVILKENRAWQYAEFALTELPEASLVWVVRDPRDMAVSWKRSPNHPGGVIQAAEVWDEDQRGYRGLVGAEERQGRTVASLRYEDLLEEPERELRRLVGVLGLDWDPGCLRFHESGYVRRNADRVRDWENLARPLLTSNKGKFRDGLEDDETALVEARCGQMMDILGYERVTDAGPEDLGALSASVQQAAGGGAQGVAGAAFLRGEEAIRRRRQAAIEAIIARPRRRGAPGV